MASSTSATFGPHNKGLEVGQNYGTLNAEFHLHAGRGETTPQPFAIIPFSRDPDFVNREGILDQIRRRLGEPPARVALVGLGGVGKSQLAIEYAYRVAADQTETWVFWIHAGTRARVEEGFRTIADAVKIPGRKDPKVNIPQLVYTWLANERNGKWMMILDSADDVDMFYRKNQEADERVLATFLPQSQNGAIILTTRDKDLAYRMTGKYENVIEVGPMAEKDALSLLEKKLGTPSATDATTALIQALDRVPLAISQAAAYIQARSPRSSLEKYLAEFGGSERRKARLLGYDAGDLRRDGGASNATLTTWQISFDHIRTKRASAADLLSLMSFFDRQGIPESLLKPTSPHDAIQKAHSNMQDDSESGSGDEVNISFEDDVAMLVNFCLVTMNEDGTMFEMHDLVQLSTRKWLEANGLQEKFQQQFVTRMAVSFPKVKYTNWTTCQKLQLHVERLMDYRPAEAELEDTWASLLYSGGEFARSQGKYDIAEQMARKASKSREKRLGLEDERTLASMANLASTYRDGGRWTEAESLEMKVLTIRKRVLGEEHHDTLDSMNNLAMTYEKLGREKEAESLKVQVLETSKRVLGEEDADTLAAMNNLVTTLMEQGRWTEADPLLTQAVEIAKRILGEEHPDTLIGRGNMVWLYMRQGRWEEAEGLAIQVIETKKRVLGAEHPETLTAIANLAKMYTTQNRWTEAESLGVQAMKTRKKVLGEKHPDTLSNMSDVAFIWSNQGRNAEALALVKDCLPVQKRILGPEHPHTLNSLAAEEALSKLVQNQ